MTGPVPRAVRARSFDAWAADYDRYRPSYPPALFDLVAERLHLPKRPVVVDLGAGTGKATLAMIRRGWQVTAVEPGEPMLAILRRQAADARLDVTTLQATAEETGLPSAAFDLATAGEAYHWFEAPRALAEIGRLLHPGGGLACFWNDRDVGTSAVLSDYDELAWTVGEGTSAAPAREEASTQIMASRAFEEPTFEQVRHEVAMTGEEFIGLAFTKSRVRTADPSVQDRFRTELETVLRRHGIERTTRFGVPYVIDCWMARRRAGQSE